MPKRKPFLQCPECGERIFESDAQCMSCEANLAEHRRQVRMEEEAEEEEKRTQAAGAGKQEEDRIASPAAEVSSRAPVAQPVEQQFATVLCPFCQTTLSLDPPRTTGDKLACGACGRELTIAGSMHQPGFWEKVGAAGQGLQAMGYILLLLPFLLIALLLMVSVFTPSAPGASPNAVPGTSAPLAPETRDTSLAPKMVESIRRVNESAQGYFVITSWDRSVMEVTLVDGFPLSELYSTTYKLTEMYRGLWGGNCTVRVFRRGVPVATGQTRRGQIEVEQLGW